jgi:iron-sulfur cluster assembly protein
MILLSDSAANEILRIKAKRHNSGLLLRLGIQSTGCLGLSYTLEFNQGAQLDDQVFHCNGIEVLIDSRSLPYLNVSATPMRPNTVVAVIPSLYS